MLHVQVAIQLSNGFVKERTSLLGELAVDNDGDLFNKPMLDLLFVGEEEGLYLIWVCKVDCTCNMASFEFIVKAGIKNLHLSFFLHQLGKSLRQDCIALGVSAVVWILNMQHHLRGVFNV